jgi:hypothetical protein
MKATLCPSAIAGTYLPGCVLAILECRLPPFEWHEISHHWLSIDEAKRLQAALETSEVAESDDDAIQVHLRVIYATGSIARLRIDSMN